MNVSYVIPANAGIQHVPLKPTGHRHPKGT